MIPTMNGNVIMLGFPHMPMLHDFVMVSQITQYSVKLADDNTLVLSTPVTKALEDYMPGVIHGARARAKDTEKPTPKPPTGGGDGTPPSGGTPGTPVLDKYTYTEARAA